MKAAAEARGGATLTRDLAFVRSEDTVGRLSLVAAAADGTVAVAEWQTNGEEENAWAQGADVSSSKGKLVTSALFRVGQGPVRLEIFQRGIGRAKNGRDFFSRKYERSRGEEGVFVNGDVDAVFCRRADAGGSPDREPSSWQCTQVSFNKQTCCCY